MALSNSLFPSSFENPRVFSDGCVLFKLSAKLATNHSRYPYN